MHSTAHQSAHTNKVKHRYHNQQLLVPEHGSKANDQSILGHWAMDKKFGKTCQEAEDNGDEHLG